MTLCFQALQGFFGLFVLLCLVKFLATNLYFFVCFMYVVIGVALDVSQELNLH